MTVRLVEGLSYKGNLVLTYQEAKDKLITIQQLLVLLTKVISGDFKHAVCYR
jgi:hypothetical protein